MVVFFVLAFIHSYSQNTVKGYIYSGEDQPVIGATVIVKDTDLATITNLEGQFKLQALESDNAVLSISSVGFNNLDQQITAKDILVPLSIKLTESVTNLPEVIIESVSMTGGLTHLRKSQGSAHFVSQKEIQKFSYTDISRTLRNVPGVNIQEEDGYGLRPNIGFRGTGSERSSKITVMEDGILAAPAPYAAPAAYYFPTIGRMEAIEILKGSSQIKYGPFTTGGAINLISTPIPLDFSGHADFIVGSHGYKMIHANLGDRHRNIGYMVETLQYGSDGYKKLDSGGQTGFNKEDYLAKVKINTNPDAPVYQSLQFKIGQANETSNETYLGLTEEDFIRTPFRRYAGSQVDLMNTEQRQYVLTHHIQATSFLDIVTSAYRNEFSRNWYKLDKVNGAKISNILANPKDHSTEFDIVKGEVNAEDALYVKANNRSYYSKGLQTNFIAHFSDGKLRHKIDLAIRIHSDQIDRFQWADIYDIENGIMKLSNAGVPGTESNRVETAIATAAYLQYKLSWDKLSITPGLRYENIEISRSEYGKEDPERSGAHLSSRQNEVDIFIPGLGFNYALDASVAVFGGVHKGFAPPGSKKRTQAEESWNYELGSRINKGAYRLQLIAYYNDYSNLLGSDLAAVGGQGSNDLFDGGEATAKGVELEATYDPMLNTTIGMNMPISLVYTYTDATFGSSFDSDFEAWGDVQKGFHPPYTPRHQLALSFSLEHSKFLFDISGKYNGAMLARAGLFEDASVARTDGYFTTDVSLNYRLTPIISAFANVNNLTNKTYVASLRPAGLRPGLPRTFNFGLKANF